MKIKCPKCNKYFIPTSQIEFINQSIISKVPLIMIDCTLCYHHFPFHIKEIVEQGWSIRCPSKGCYGVVHELDIEHNFLYGCGTCGHIWDSKEKINDSIQQIIKHFPYRKLCYVYIDGNFENTEIDYQPYENKIIQELFYEK